MILPFLSTYWGAAIWAKTCDSHHHNLGICLHYCINGLHLATFLGFKFSTNIADLHYAIHSNLALFPMRISVFTNLDIFPGHDKHFCP